ncbi:MAG: glycosyltransferase family 4 protein [Isosphaeraceae bacterium]
MSHAVRPTGIDVLEPLRVLHCVAGNLYGGVESFLRTLAECRGLTPGVEPEFALCFGGRLEVELKAAGVPVHRVGGVRFSRPWTAWQARRRLAQLVESRNVHVVVCHACWPQSLFGPAARRAGVPLVFWAHDRVSDPLHWLEKRAARVAPDLALVQSHFTAETLPRLYPGVPSEVLRLPVRPRPVDRDTARAAVRAELGTPADDFVTVTTCRLERWKGHTLLLDALGRLRDRGGWSAWVAGGVQRPQEQIYLDELKAQAAALGIDDRVRFLGSRDDVPRLLAAADVHCQPNLGPEPFGIAYVEALYAGLPVVSTRMGGAAEIVTEDCGVLVPPGDAASLADALGILMDDPSRRTRLGAAGPARALSLCDPATVLGRLAALLRQTCMLHIS